MTNERRRELAEKWRAEYNSTNKPWQVILESAFLEIEREVREEIKKELKAAPITYFGPDPSVVENLRDLMILAIREGK